MARRENEYIIGSPNGYMNVLLERLINWLVGLMDS